MADQTTNTDRPTAIACPWCSTAVTAETAVCPSCNAILIADQEHDLPGVTSFDQKAARPERPAPQRSRFLAWLGGDAPDTTQPTAVEVQAIAPPDEAVQREILRLELEAHISNLQAEADSILSDALIEGRVADLPEGLRPLADAEAAAPTPAELADELVEAAMRDSAATGDTADVGDAVEADATEPAAAEAADDQPDTDTDQPDTDQPDPDRPA